MKINTLFRTFRTYSKRILASLVVIVLGMGVCVAAIPQKTSAATITVNSPSNGQQFTGNDFTVSGVADSDASVFLIRNGLTIAQTRSDGSGAWSAQLTGLPDGQNTITVRSIKNTGFGYYIGGNQSSSSIHQLRLSDNAINPNAPYPVAQTDTRVLMVPSPNQSIFYLSSSFTDQNLKPAKFSTAAPADPIAVSGSYPSGPANNKGDFSADGTKYYSANDALTVLSVLNVATNAWTKDIELGGNPVTAWRGPNDKIYVTISGPAPKLKIIDPSTDTIIKTVNLDCDGTVPTVIFSQDTAYPNYFAPCVSENGSKVIKYDIATDAEVSSFTVSFNPTNGILNADNSKLYITSSSAFPNNSNSNKIFIFDSSNGAAIKTVTMHSGVLGIFQSPDLQHIYAATPGNNFDSSGIDILDMFTDTLQHLDTGNTVVSVSAPSTAATLSNVSVSVVLGVKTATSGGGTLANTGALAVSSSLLIGLLVAAFAYTYWDYRRHKQPLVEVDPDAKHTYTYLHHVRMVTIPLLKYRVNFSVARSNAQDGIHKF